MSSFGYQVEEGRRAQGTRFEKDSSSVVGPTSLAHTGTRRVCQATVTELGNLTSSSNARVCLSNWILVKLSLVPR